MLHLGRGLAAALACELLAFPPALHGGWTSESWGWSVGMFMFLGPVSAIAYAAAFAIADKLAARGPAALRIAITVTVPVLGVAAVMLPGLMGEWRYSAPHLNALIFPFAPILVGGLAGALARETGGMRRAA